MGDSQQQTTTSQPHAHLREVPVPEALMKRRRLQKIRVTCMLVIAFVGIFFFGTKITRNKLAINDLQTEIAQSQEELDVVETYHSDLEEYVALLQDEEYVANLARSEYFLSKEGEIVFNFIDEQNTLSSDINEKQEEKQEKEQALEEAN